VWKCADLSLAGIREKTTQIKKGNMNPLERYKSEADSLTKQIQTPQTRARLQFLLAAIKTCKEFSDVRAIDEQSAQEEFRDYLLGRTKASTRTYSALTEANTGQVVPASFYHQLLTGMSQYTELMNPDNVSLIESEKALPLTIPEIDLSTITSAIVAQGVDAPPVANPTISSMVLNGFSYRTNPIASTFELEQDSFEAITDVLTKAFSVGLARGIGGDLINGSGSGSPTGLLTAATDSGIVSSAALTYTSADLREIFFKVNRAYRVSPKCAWVMNDTTYENIRSLSDTSGRPLISIVEDKELLFGKPLRISPDMPITSGSKSLLFGDLSQFQVRLVRSGVMVRRNLQAPGYAEKGAALYTCYARVDSALNTVGSTSPVVFSKFQ
jgi:HK97 family phage major capsid protein